MLYLPSLLSMPLLSSHHPHYQLFQGHNLVKQQQSCRNGSRNHSAKIKREDPLLSSPPSSIFSAHRENPSTPFTAWKMPKSNPSHDDTLLPASFSPSPLPVSARKLAAILWELQDVPHYQISYQLHSHSNGKPITQLAPPPSSSSLSQQRMRKHTSIQHKFADKSRKHTHCRKQASGPHSPGIRLLKNHTAATTKQMPRLSKLEEEADNKTTNAPNSVLNLTGLLGCPDHGARTSGDLLNWMRNLEDRNTSSIFLISTLHKELDSARSQLQSSIGTQKLYCKEIDTLTKRLAEEKAMWQEKAQERVRMAVCSIRVELQEEKRSKRELEAVHKKVVQDFNEMKATFGRNFHDLERERKARELMEEVCNELGREIGKDKAEVEKMKRESAKVREELEEERKMLQMAEVWREEQVQMKLAEARLQLEEKNVVIDKLQSELEMFFRARMDCDANNMGSSFRDEEIESHKYSADFLDLHEDRLTALNSDAGHSEAINPSPSLVEPVQQGEIRDTVHVMQGHDDEDSADDDLHSIELYNDNFVSNTGPSPWSHLQQEVLDTSDEENPTIDKMERGKWPLCEKVNELENRRSDQVDARSAVIDSKVKSELIDGQKKGEQWIGRTIERGEMKQWCQDLQSTVAANTEVNVLWQNVQEESQSLKIFSAGTLGKHMQGHTDTFFQSGIVSVEGTSLRPRINASDSQIHNSSFRVRSQGSLKDSHTYSGFPLMQQPENLASSPTRQWNHCWSSHDPGSPILNRTGKGLTDMPRVAWNNTL